MSKKTQIANIILSMTHSELDLMANDFIEMQSNAEDDGSGWNLESKTAFYDMLRTWAKGLGSLE